MDPNVALEKAASLAAEGDFVGATLAYQELDVWLRRGGFLPLLWEQRADE